jgi:8-hydroxy-5-deazaflavin:NADPH oxidoreductase
MPKIGLIGGTGDLGPALAVHLAKKNKVLLGSRNKEKAESAIQEILQNKQERSSTIKPRLEPATNDSVSSSCDIIILTVPYNAALDTMAGLRDKFMGNQLVISAVAAMRKSGMYFVPVQGSTSIAQGVQNILPKSVLVAAAFQTVPAKVLYNEETIDADVLVCADNDDAFSQTAEIISSIPGLRPLLAGTLESSSEIEGLTALLLNLAINAHLKSPTLKIHSF